MSQKFSVEHLGMSYQEQNCIWFQPILTIEMRVTLENPRKIIFKVTSVNGCQSWLMNSCVSLLSPWSPGFIPWSEMFMNMPGRQVNPQQKKIGSLLFFSLILRKSFPFPFTVCLPYQNKPMAIFAWTHQCLHALDRSTNKQHTVESMNQIHSKGGVLVAH